MFFFCREADSKDAGVQASPKPSASDLNIEKVALADDKTAVGSEGSRSSTAKEAAHTVVASPTNDTADYDGLDPLAFEARKRANVTSKQIKADYPKGNKRKLKKYYTRQNELIDQFLGAGDEERLGIAEDLKMGPKIKFAINASFSVNFCLFCIQLYAAVSTGSLSLFATAADAFVSHSSHRASNVCFL